MFLGEKVLEAIYFFFEQLVIKKNHLGSMLNIFQMKDTLNWLFCHLYLEKLITVTHCGKRATKFKR